MVWLKNGKLISDAESRELISKGYQYVEGVLLSSDDVNDLIKSGYTRPHLAEGLRYTFTSKEKKSLGILGVSLVSWGAWKVGRFAKIQFDNIKRKTPRTVPEGKQLSLLKEYLDQNDIVPIKGATTYWCIVKDLKLDSSKED